MVIVVDRRILTEGNDGAGTPANAGCTENHLTRSVRCGLNNIVVSIQITIADARKCHGAYAAGADRVDDDRQTGDIESIGGRRGRWQKLCDPGGAERKRSILRQTAIKPSNVSLAAPVCRFVCERQPSHLSPGIQHALEAVAQLVADT